MTRRMKQAEAWRTADYGDGIRPPLVFFLLRLAAISLGNETAKWIERVLLIVY
ncbi:hypothetical protein AB1L42_00915 [Thalassoglobus sp. JC818]|uniref:hypothetical protein n=1 Tax=Thalassoglobus sp. JC818 TaxID=3232136 RepID=UPI003459BE9E